MEPKGKDTGRDQVSQVRKHYYLDEYAVIAPGRNRRPQHFRDQPLVSQKTDPHPAIEDEPAVYKLSGATNGEWRVKVIENKYPAYREDNQRALGRQEVVLETAQANTPFHQLSVASIEDVLKTYQRRVEELYDNFGYVSVFKNHGRASGASLSHTHSQIIASRIVPPDVRRDKEAFTQYQHQFQTSAMCDIIRWELAQAQRLVAHTRYTTTICPYASRFPLEVWIIPNRQSHSIADLSDEEIHSLADHLKGVTLALGSNGIDFNYHLSENVPELYNHFLIKVTPRITTPGGYELNTGVYINPVSPEYAAWWYKRYIKTPHVG